MKDLVVGQVLGRYELLVPIAKGGMAQVWAARLRGTRGFQKIVAVKTILAGAIDDERMEQMFLAEATLASQIHHPNVVGTIELGEEEGMLYLVMEWVDGESLNLIMNRSAGRGGMPLPIAVNLIGQALKGLHAAHDLRDETGTLLGVVHRDISAQNVLVTYSGSAKLVDFGIAKATARSSGLTQAGEIKGKFAYLAPEQALAQPVDRRTDIFGMGILLYFLTTGRHPFKGTSPGETLQKICSGEPRRPTDILPGYPAELEAVIDRALKKNPDERWLTANEMLSALEKAMPQCLDGSFEVQIADYMSQLLGNRSRERRTELRLAQQMLDGSGSKRLSLDAMMGSSGSLRAISVDGKESKAPEDSQSQRKIVVDLRPSAPIADASSMSSFKKYRAQAVIGLSAGIVLFGTVKLLSNGSPNLPSMGAASPVPAAATALPAMVDPQPPPAPAKIAPVAPPAPPDPVAIDGKESAKKGAKKAPPGPAPAPRASAVPAAPAAPATAPEKPRVDSRDGASNAWDPGSFGGRR